MITVHAGEDFQFLVSGMRMMDEAVQFCDHRPYDRIGHGLAPGMDPRTWVAEQWVIYIKAREHLDNLVWLHHYALQLVKARHPFDAVVLLLQEKIEKWSRFIYQQALTPDALYQAWLLRRNCPSYFQHEDNMHTATQEKTLLYPDLVGRKAPHPHLEIGNCI